MIAFLASVPDTGAKGLAGAYLISYSLHFFSCDIISTLLGYCLLRLKHFIFSLYLHVLIGMSLKGVIKWASTYLLIFTKLWQFNAWKEGCKYENWQTLDFLILVYALFLTHKKLKIYGGLFQSSPGF